MRKHKGLSGGSIFMLLFIALVIVGCVWLFPKIIGNVDVRTEAYKIISAVHDDLNTKQNKVVVTSQLPLATPTLKLDNVEFSKAEIVNPATSTPHTYKQKRINITFAGTVDFDKKLYNSCISEDNFNANPIFDFLKNIANNEYSLALINDTFVDDEDYSDTNMPSAVINTLNVCGFNSIMVGNRSILNYGTEGLKKMTASAMQNNMLMSGAHARNESKPVIMKYINDVPIALINFTQSLSVTGKNAVDIENRDNHITLLNKENIENELKRAKDEGAKIVICTVIWDDKHDSIVNEDQYNYTQLMSQNGADVVVCSNAQASLYTDVITTENENGDKQKTVVSYSLGSLLTSVRDRTAHISSYLLHISMIYDEKTDKHEIENLEYTPLYIWYQKINNKMQYKVLNSAAGAPEGMNDKQKETMEKSKKHIENVLMDSPVNLRIY